MDFAASFQYGWDTSCSSMNEPMVDSGKASDISVSSWPVEPNPWAPFSLLQQLSRQQPVSTGTQLGGTGITLPRLKVGDAGGAPPPPPAPPSPQQPGRRPRSFCEGMELSTLERSWTA